MLRSGREEETEEEEELEFPVLAEGGLTERVERLGGDGIAAVHQDTSG